MADFCGDCDEFSCSECYYFVSKIYEASMRPPFSTVRDRFQSICHYSRKLLISQSPLIRYANIVLGGISICNVLCTGVDIVRMKIKYPHAMCRDYNMNR